MKKSKKKNIFADEVMKQIQEYETIIKNAPQETFVDLETGEDVTMEEIFGESNNELKKLDRWVEKILLSNSNTKLYPKRPYPYKSYNKVDELLRIHGKELIEKLVDLCPFYKKQHKLEHKENIIDSISWIIWTKRIDPRSLMPSIPEFGNMWDRISERGYQE